MASQSRIGVQGENPRPMKRVQVQFNFRLSWLLLLGSIVATQVSLMAQDQKSINKTDQNKTGAVRVAIVGMEHGNVDGFLSQLPKHHDVELVGIVDSHESLIARYEKKYALPETLFFKSTEKMIEERHPQAVLVYTSIGEHRHAIET